MPTPAEHAERILAARHVQLRKPNKDRFVGAEKFKDRVKIDAKRQEMSDEKWIAEMMGVE